MKRNKKIKRFSTIIIVLLFVYTSLPSFAYQFNGWVLSNPLNVKFKVGASVGSYSNLVSTSANQWNSCPEITIYKTTGSGENIFFVGSYSVNTGNYAVTYHSSNNYHTITLYKDFKDSNDSIRKETVVHEVGHALGLAHCQSYLNSVSVMRETGFNGVNGPMSDDKAGIASLY